jgi:hypothetical protein
MCRDHCSGGDGCFPFPDQRWHKMVLHGAHCFLVALEEALKAWSWTWKTLAMKIF